MRFQIYFLILLFFSLNVQAINWHFPNPLGKTFEVMHSLKGITIPVWFTKVILLNKKKLQNEIPIKDKKRKIEEDKYTFRPDGSLRKITLKDGSLRLNKNQIFWTDKNSLAQWNWEGKSCLYQKRNTKGKIQKTETLSFFSSGSMRREVLQNDKAQEDIYSPLGMLISQKVINDGELIRKDKWKYNNQGILIYWLHQTLKQKEEHIYEWKDNQIIKEIIKKKDQIFQTIHYQKNGRIIQRFGQAGENLGIFWIEEKRL